MDSHIIITGKGGVGKSFAARQLHEFFSSKGRIVHGFDTDPVNATYAEHQQFYVTIVPLLDASNKVDERNFDTFFEHVAMLPEEDSVVIVDNGAATFLPFCSYMASCPALPVLQSRGTVYLHSIVTGGSLKDTLENFEDLARHFPGIPIVVWLNPYFGPIVNSHGHGFEEMPEYELCQDSIHALVRVPDLIPATYGKDMEMLMARRQTYDEALQDATGQWGLMAKQRLMIIRRDMAAALENANIG